MKTLIIMLIFTMAFIGFHINGYSYNYNSSIVTKEPEKNEHSDKLSNYTENKKLNENENENEN